MSLRYIGGLVSPSVNPLAANVTTSPNVAQYNGLFTLQQQAQALTSNQWATDPYYKNTTLLLHADGKANGSQNNTFLDSSTNNFTITRNGNATQGSFTPYGNGWSVYTNGSSQDVLIADNAAFQPGSGDFTYEAFVYPLSLPSSGNFKTFWSQRALVATGYGGACPVVDSSGNILLFVANSGATGWQLVGASTGFTITINQWQHISITRSGNTITLYKNGIAGTTSTVATGAVGTSGGLSLMAGSYDGGQLVDGYMSNFRMVKGTAIVPPVGGPTSPLTAVSGTGLLTLQSNRFVDNSTNNFTVGPVGSPSVQRFSPFAPQYQYTPAVIGGSGYFDGSGDYLTLPVSSAFDLGTNACCIEAWVYMLNTNGVGLFCTSTGGAGQTRPNFAVGPTGFQADYFGNVFFSGSATIPLNSWNHVAFTRSATNGAWRFFVNGVLTGYNATGTQNLLQTTVNQLIGRDSGGTSANSYISDLRITNGSVPTSYQTASTTTGTLIFTPSSSPITTSSQGAANVSLLTNMTNAGIYDNAMMSNLETVGNAQVSTSVVKYGSGSLYFDGSGDYLYIPTSTNFGFGTGDFTLECWVYPTAWAGTTDGFVSCEYGSGATVSGVQISRDGIEIGNNSGSSTAYAWSNAIPLNTWTHVVATRSGGTVRGFINGVLSTTPATNNTNVQTTQALVVGRRLTDYNGYYFTGYMDDVRITKGVARYTANFIPPKVAFSNQ